MNILEFLNLSNEKQWDVFWDNGVHLDTVEDETGRKQLYSLFSFYVELLGDGAEPLQLIPFTAGPRLDKYVWDRM